MKLTFKNSRTSDTSTSEFLKDHENSRIRSLTRMLISVVKDATIYFSYSEQTNTGQHVQQTT